MQRANLNNLFFLSCLTVFLVACEDTIEQASLPYIGQHQTESKTLADGRVQTDTIYYTVPKFSFINQSNQEVSHHDYQGKVFVADFFFTTCPTICPIMSSQMARIQVLAKQDGVNNELAFLSHSIDPSNDTPEVLSAYAERLEADLSNWNFVTGDPTDIYDQARTGYMITALEVESAPGGYIHSDNFVLVDKAMHIRGYYDGTSTKEVDQLLKDIKKLLDEPTTR